ncbi:unnamed protein product [Danaus chrysippus]|uniref:(African queen) hypothetical protein n=1 Tax=Danaus chrysippus TaxID=151541 RepID=A0A8J2R1B0_9NEOP|nr:unnamed protein product [Danaus chrysippus]
MEMIALMENDLNIRFDMDHNKIFTLDTLLDPRYKQQFFEAEDLITIRSQFFVESLKNSMSDDDSDSGNDDLQSTSTDKNNIETATHKNFWQCYQNFASRKIQEFQDDKSSSAHELQSYGALPVIKRNDDPFQWWSRNSSRYPEMSRMAKVYLCCPASSVYR